MHNANLDLTFSTVVFDVLKVRKRVDVLPLRVCCSAFIQLAGLKHGCDTDACKLQVALLIVSFTHTHQRLLCR